jgi:hypothetical protein
MLWGIAQKKVGFLNSNIGLRSQHFGDLCITLGSLLVCRLAHSKYKLIS